MTERLDPGLARELQQEALEPIQRRRPYRLTEHGAKALAAQLRSVREVVATGLARLATA